MNNMPPINKANVIRVSSDPFFVLLTLATQQACYSFIYGICYIFQTLLIILKDAIEGCSG